MDRNVAIYRKRYIPNETNYLKDDIIVHMDDKIIVTKWDTIKKREDIKTGINKTDGKYVVVPNRKDAIRYCINNAQEGDIIVLAGKGHEDYQEIKGVKYHMDERELIAEILSEK